MTVNISYFAGAGWQFFTDDGIPLSGGLLFTYAAGTTTPATTYTTSAGTIANSNPIVLNSAGRLDNEIWLTQPNLYKFELKTSTNVLIGTYDDIPGIITADAIFADLANTTDVTKGDALIGFRQSNTAGALTGAVGKTVHQKLQDVVSVKDFGATGDGTTDDTAAIQLAVTAAANKALYFPDGTYLNATAPAGIGQVYCFGSPNVAFNGYAPIVTSSAPPLLALDFTANTAALANTVGQASKVLTTVRASGKYVEWNDGVWRYVGNNVLPWSDKGVLIEEARENHVMSNRNLTITYNLLLNSVSGSYIDGETVTATGGGSGIFRQLTTPSAYYVADATGTFTGTLTGGTSGATGTIGTVAPFWTATDITAYFDQVGIDNSPNSATSLLATADNATIFTTADVGPVPVLTDRVTSAFVRRISGAGDVEMTDDGGSTWTTITLTKQWTRFVLPYQNIASPQVGFRLTISGDSIAVDFVQNEDGRFATSPIYCLTSVQTRAADSCFMNWTNYTNLLGLRQLVIDTSFTPNQVESSGTVYDITDNSNADSIRLGFDSSTLEVKSAGTTTAVGTFDAYPLASAGFVVAAGVTSRHLGSFDMLNRLVSVSLDGSDSTEGNVLFPTTVTSWPNVGFLTRINIGSKLDLSQRFNGYIKNVNLYSGSKTPAQLETSSAI
jgi:Pectate lyase superfamily protein